MANDNSSARTNQGETAASSKQKKLLLNLHVMPKTVTKQWRKWLVLGISIFILLLLASYALYYYFL
ncbi:MAG: hypothetical protein ACOX0C_00145 [Patescibacteria group bacterium]|jgi:hypothetical protein